MEKFPKTALESHGDVDSSAKETYGEGKTLFRIGNGGAGKRNFHQIEVNSSPVNVLYTGATGLIEALAKDYLSTITSSNDDSQGTATTDSSIDWVCNHSRNTQLALLHNYIDIALTYERDQENLAEAEGWSNTVGCAFHDHFVLAGPASDPANIQVAHSVTDALAKIANSSCLFHSRADASATMWKERSLWKMSNLTPWDPEHGAENEQAWYKTSLLNPSEALMAADAAGAYLIIDRSTLLRQTALKTIDGTTVFFEPQDSNDVLMNSCFALVSTRPRFPERASAASRFLDYLFSDRGQKIIADFGKAELGGFPLFAARKDGFARSYLRGSMPYDGKWTMI